ncbi:MAG: AMP-binding protein [Gammaproteobacteria bacterium]|nr:AMP-binding protein [Gammaproteobacteria bacterium]
MNIANFLVRASCVAPGRPAVYCGTSPTHTFATLAQSCAGFAGGLREVLKLAAGERVALVMKNCPAYVECMFGCWHAGLTCVPVNAKLHAREIAFILQNSGARLVLVTADLANTVGEALGFVEDPEPVVIEVGSADYRKLAGHAPIPMRHAAPDAVAWLFYTSGTTGRPKGAKLTHRNLTAMTLNYFVDVDTIAPGDCALHPAPMSHGSGMYLLPHVLGFGAQVVPESGRFEPDEIATLLAAHPGASFFAAPTMVSRLVSSGRLGPAALANLKSIIYGGGPMYVADCKAALAAFGQRLVQIYGQGESPMTITVLPKHMHLDDGDPRYEARLASVGYAQAPVEVRTVSPTGEPLAIGEIGEIVVRGDTVMAGYWNNPQATADSLRDGWLWTGDVGSFDEEGLLTLRDRSKDMIISGGTNIYPREVEEVLLRHPAVAEVAIVGRVHPDWGEELVAFVATAPGASVTPEELDELCVTYIARFKRPKVYRFIDVLPKNHYGKVLKTELRQVAVQNREADRVLAGGD